MIIDVFDDSTFSSYAFIVLVRISSLYWPWRVNNIKHDSCLIYGVEQTQSTHEFNDLLYNDSTIFFFHQHIFFLRGSKLAPTLAGDGRRRHGPDVVLPRGAVRPPVGCVFDNWRFNGNVHGEFSRFGHWKIGTFTIYIYIHMYV